MIASVPTPDGEQQAQLATPIKFSNHAPSYRHIGARIGAHNDEVLRALGKTDAEIAQLRREGVLGKLPRYAPG